MTPPDTRTARQIIEQRIAELLSDGSMIPSGMLDNGVPLYSLTAMGRETREKLIKAFLAEKAGQTSVHGNAKESE